MVHLIYDNGQFTNKPHNGLDLDAEHFPFRHLDSEYFSQLKKQNEYYRKVSVNDLIEFFEELRISWSKRDSQIQKRLGFLGINFLLIWLSKNNLERISNLSMRGNREFLDEFIEMDFVLRKKIKAQPRGLIAHWLSGNVPLLGMISLTHSILTKNSNIVKVPQRFGLVLPLLVDSFKDINITTSRGVHISGKDICKTISIVYHSRQQAEAGYTLSKHADVRVVWGGKEALEAILNYPRNITTVDIVFGPKYSYAVVGKEILVSQESAQKIAYALALDASLFEQEGCNSPHTIFVEEGGNVSPLEFSEHLARGLEQVLKRVPKQPLDQGTVVKILNLRAEYDIMGEAFYSKGVEWTVLFSEEEKDLAQICTGRVLFVRTLKDIFSAADLANHGTQSIAVALEGERKIKFADKCTRNGIDRCPTPGTMSLYDTPWDGMFPMDRMVRWVSVSI